MCVSLFPINITRVSGGRFCPCVVVWQNFDVDVGIFSSRFGLRVGRPISLRIVVALRREVRPRILIISCCCSWDNTGGRGRGREEDAEEFLVPGT